MFYLIGTGLIPEQITLEGVNAAKKCSRVFLDTYTSAFSQGKVADLETILEKKIFLLERKNLEEDSKELLVLAQKNDIALLIIGNPLTATTHIQLILDAHKKRIQTQVIAGVSITNFLAKTGLDEYKFGRVCTIAEFKPNFSPDSFYSFIELNKKNGLHTLCLLDTGDGKKFLSAAKALETLEEIEKNQGKQLLQESIFVVLAGAGSDSEKIVFGSLEKIKKLQLNIFPQSLIVCGKLNDKEKEAMGALHEEK